MPGVGRAGPGVKREGGAERDRETKRAPADCNAPCQFPKLSKATWIYGSFQSNERFREFAAFRVAAMDA